MLRHGGSLKNSGIERSESYIVADVLSPVVFTVSKRFECFEMAWCNLACFDSVADVVAEHLPVVSGEKELSGD